MPTQMRPANRRTPTRALACATLVLALAGATPASAQRREAPPQAPARIQIRHDTILRYVPRWELTVDDSATSTSNRYWHRVDELPVYELVSLDADRILGGTTEAHISAWGALDATIPDEGDVLSGDFATAWARTRVRPFAFWAGRRFLAWGLPGGLHLDGVGAELQTKLGIHAEVLGGRPVATVGNTLGRHAELESATAAWGARVGYEDAGRISAAVSYLERWADGIAADRAVQATAAVRPFSRLDLLASTTFDVAQGLEEARAQVAYLVVDELEPDLTYVHADPAKLLPAWSILSMFATSVYDEGGLGVTVRVDGGFSARVEGALRRTWVPGREQDGSHWGSRGALMLRWRPVTGRAELAGEVSRRDEADTTIVVARVGAAFVPIHPLRLATTVGAAIDEHDGERTALLLRGTAELPIGSRWATSITVDLARTPIAESEVRALLRVSYAFDTEAP